MSVSFTDANNGTAVGAGVLMGLIAQSSEPQTEEQPGFHNQVEHKSFDWCLLY